MEFSPLPTDKSACKDYISSIKPPERKLKRNWKGKQVIVCLLQHTNPKYKQNFKTIHTDKLPHFLDQTLHVLLISSFISLRILFKGAEISRARSIVFMRLSQVALQMVLQPCFKRCWRILKNHLSNVFSVLSWTAMLWFCIDDMLKQSMHTVSDYCTWDDWRSLIEGADYFVHISNCCMSYSRVRIFQGRGLIEEIWYLLFYKHNISWHKPTSQSLKAIYSLTAVVTTTNRFSQAKMATG